MSNIAKRVFLCLLLLLFWLLLCLDSFCLNGGYLRCEFAAVQTHSLFLGGWKGDHEPSQCHVIICNIMLSTRCTAWVSANTQIRWLKDEHALSSLLYFSYKNYSWSFGMCWLPYRIRNIGKEATNIHWIVLSIYFIYSLITDDSLLILFCVKTLKDKNWFRCELSIVDMFTVTTLAAPVKFSDFLVVNFLKIIASLTLGVQIEAIWTLSFD